jgi:hypothetical protein
VRLRQDEDFVRRLEETSEEMRPGLETWFEEQRDSGALRADLD